MSSSLISPSGLSRTKTNCSTSSPLTWRTAVLKVTLSRPRKTTKPTPNRRAAVTASLNPEPNMPMLFGSPALSVNPTRYRA